LAEESFQNNFFDTEYLKADLKGRSIQGGVATISAQGATFLLHTGSTVVLARLLTPQDFGLIAMVTAVTSFAMMFKDMGLSMATIQRAEINHNQISTLFWINVVLSLCIMLVTAALAPVIAWFYGEPRLTWITLAMAGAFIFGGLTVQHQALLRRNMRFGTLALIGIISTVVGIVAAIISAWYGAGYWALVIMQLAGAIAGAIAVWLACGWRPGLPAHRSGIREMLFFGGNLTGFNIVNYFARNLDKVLIGKICGSGSLGLYSKAYGLLMLPINQIRGPLTSVAMPALSHIQDDPKRYVSFYTKLVLLVAFLTMPLTIFLAVCSKSVIHLLLGEQWLQAAGIFQVLALAAFIQPVSTTSGLVLLSLGRSGRYLRWGILHSLVVVTSFVVGIRWGIVGVASAYAAANYIVLFPSLWYCFRLTPMSIEAFLKAIARPAIASLIMGSVILLSRPLLGKQPDIVLLCTSFVVGFFTYFSVWTLMPGGMQILRDICGYVTLIFPKKNKRFGD